LVSLLLFISSSRTFAAHSLGGEVAEETGASVFLFLLNKLIKVACCRMFVVCQALF